MQHSAPNFQDILDEKSGKTWPSGPERTTFSPKCPGNSPLLHTSVMVKEVIDALSLHNAEVVLDATAGEGGHSEAILKAEKDVCLVTLDADLRSVEITRERLEKFDGRAQVFESNFGDIEKVFNKNGIEKIDRALFDLGWNAGQLESGKGLSFLRDEPLNMSYGKKPASGFTASEIVNSWDEKTLADVFYGYGEERYSRRIAKAIVDYREVRPIETTTQLVDIIRGAVPAVYRNGRIHCATRTFQALRIAVNDELGVIGRGLASAWKYLSCGGRIAVITFHSIEDRAVKRIFAALVKDDDGVLVVKKPLVPSREEVLINPRARSAKLRIIEKVCNK